MLGIILVGKEDLSAVCAGKERMHILSISGIVIMIMKLGGMGKNIYRKLLKIWENVAGLLLINKAIAGMLQQNTQAEPGG